MNNEVKNVPSLRFPGFIDEWKTVKLGDVANKGQYGLNAAATEFDGVNKYIRITDIDESTNQFSQDNLTSPSGNFSDKYLLQQGDILFARTGASVGKSYIYNEKDGKVYFAGFLMKFKITNADAKFIFYNTLRHSYDKWVKTMSARSGQPGINAEEYESLKFNLPSKQEQEKIAEFLTAVDERIELASSKVEKLETYKRGLTQKIFTRILRFKRDDGSDFPEWEDKRLGDLANIYQPVTISQNEIVEGEYPVYGANGIVGYHDSYNHELPQIAVTCRGNTCGTVNFTTGKSWITGNAMVINVDDSTNIVDKIFLLQILKFSDLRYLITGSGQPQITGEIKTHRVSLPSLEEQQKIATFLSQIDEKITLETQKLEGLRKFKKALLQRMFV